MRLRPGDVLVTIFENEPRRGEPVDVDEYPEPDGPLRLGARDFQPFDGVTEDSRATGHGFARRTFRLSDRLFVLFAEAGERAPRRATLGALNELLASLAVEPGDFYPGTAAPPRFPATDGWFVGSSAPDEARAEGEFTTAWASTIPYADEWNALPPFETLRRLPRDGIAIWVGVSRSNRFPPERAGDVVVAKREPPFKLADFERREGWEGQVGEVPEYLLLTSVRGQYGVDLRVYFGRRNPSDEAVAEADAMLSRLRLPDWGHWETG